MLLDFLSSYYRRHIDDGWGAFELGALQKSEEHFRTVIESVHDPKITVFDLAEAHNGMGALNILHNDLFEAHRWYREAFHILDEYHRHVIPERLSWGSYHDRPLMRCLMALGHLAYQKGDRLHAQEYYDMLLCANSHDEIGVGGYIRALERGQSFEEAQRSNS